ncbi:hypothetical protein JR316_0001555 [Psilocybe cubensis]|uniref:Uncharacterized protein n=5 Tax=Psilocybe cubensis TaxID=181762 RepID=A0ACB8HHY8_PSICU|nr:hypothetical protein JR316_0012428 [Psilocybe cubensis]XP_047743020.1 hypothetical protein JR316_0012506 [Psilocybe cubensis]XP_047744590.1 hypothetical protein JR316_0010881 [Psilocybe cubensis]XP_047747503.1 hypothetical protein JR316_0008474 [Psilocybe cubensis]XP_047755104.1 hypothetical protein JR316_0001555 [Psilocybe cubensis]KAH9475317.1 hypothetical protein JR316_0012428 [Psilocybe cubensis]KAH9475395.1 hypothetical protein JR316_0012506 [Psilocybe cubensis]KAH9476965.1 hypotheti
MTKQSRTSSLNDIIKIGQDCLTLDLPPSLQVEQRKLFRQTVGTDYVLKAYPDIFNHSLQNDQSERLDLVEQYIIERLEMARYNVRKRKGDFHAFGITKQEMIYAVSRWTPDYIHGFLHRFANFSQTKMTEMEIELLQAHFLHYF